MGGTFHSNAVSRFLCAVRKDGEEIFHSARRSSLAAMPSSPAATSLMHNVTDKTAVPARADFTRLIVAIVIGNGFVAYDFTVYSFSAVLIGKLYFPSSSPASSVLLSLATFGAGFVMRPLGAVLIGHIADTRGRKAGMTVSLLLMTIGTWT